MNEVHDFILAHAPRLFGVIGTLVFAAIFIWKLKLRPSTAEALVAALAFVICGFIVEYITLPISAMFTQPVRPIDLLMFGVVDFSTGLISVGYAFLILASFRRLQRQFAGDDDAAQ
jgi:hypothetical protein